MNITESLKLQADLQEQIEHIQERLLACVRVEKGCKSLEKPETLYRTLDKLLKQLGTIYTKMEMAIFHAGNKEKSLIEMLSEQKILTLRIKLIKETLDKAKKVSEQDGVFYESTIDVNLIEKQLITLEELKCEVDSKIQSLFQMTEIEH